MNLNHDEPFDSRDEDNPDWVVDEELSCTNTGFGGSDPAAGPPPVPELDPTWL